VESAATPYITVGLELLGEIKPFLWPAAPASGTATG